MKHKKDTINIELGSIVVSKCGRDENRYYVVVAYSNQIDHVMCSDGDFRKQASPKKKRVKHLKFVTAVPVLKQKLLEGSKVFDSEIFSAIKAVQSETAESVTTTDNIAKV